MNQSSQSREQARVLRVLKAIEGTELKPGDFFILCAGRAPRMLRFVDVGYDQIGDAYVAGDLQLIGKGPDSPEAAGLLRQIADLVPPPLPAALPRAGGQKRTKGPTTTPLLVRGGLALHAGGAP